MLKPTLAAYLAFSAVAAAPVLDGRGPLTADPAAPSARTTEGRKGDPAMAPAPGPVMAPAPAASAPAVPALPTLTLAFNAEEARLEVPIPPGTPIEERASATAWRLFVPGWGAPADQAAMGFADPVLGTLTVRQEPNGVSLILPWKYACPTAITWLDGPPRLSITLRKVFRMATSEDVATGVVHEQVRSADAAGPLSVHVLRVDPRAPGVRVAPALAKDAFWAREPVSAIARRNGAVAAINGSYFSTKTGEPLGLLMIDGELVSGPMFNRTALALGGAETEIGRTQLATRLQLPAGESYDFDGVNQPRGLNRMVLYTSRYGASTFSPADAKGAAEYTLLPDGTVIGVVPGNAPIPPGGMVIAAHGQAAEWLEKRVHVGDKLAVRSALAELWPGVRHVIGGGPTLLAEGRVHVTAEQEQFRSDITHGRAPRTAVGVDRDGKLLLVTVDGRQPRTSVGLTLDGLAKLMRELGAHDALNLDGGGSTAMTVGPATVNRPSDGGERPVNNALLVFAARAAGAVSATP